MTGWSSPAMTVERKFANVFMVLLLAETQIKFADGALAEDVLVAVVLADMARHQTLPLVPTFTHSEPTRMPPSCLSCLFASKGKVGWEAEVGQNVSDSSFDRDFEIFRSHEINPP